MNNNSIFSKTAKGIEEINKRSYGLVPKLRQILILIDGKTSIAELTWKVPDLAMLVETITKLATEGFIAETSGSKVTTNSATAAAIHSFSPMGRAQFAELLRQELAAYLGPLAGIVVEENLPKDQPLIQQHMMVVIIGAIAEEIDDTAKRQEFITRVNTRLASM